jgi:F-type H+-transporting ATPase subunit epsilon
MTYTMNLEILLPFEIFTHQTDVRRLVVETRSGSFGLLPRRRDCAAVLVPGILMYETPQEGEVFLAVDHGVLVKAGANVLVSVRRAVGGVDLQHLHESVEREFQTVNEFEQQTRSMMAKLESGFLHHFATFQHE